MIKTTKQLKKQYKQLINLIIKHRKLELGKLGFTTIPKQAICNITSDPNTLFAFTTQLYADNLIQSIPQLYIKSALHIKTKDPTQKNNIIIYCTKTHEYMTEYLNTL